MSRFYDEIYERVKVSDIIKRYIKLDKKGREWLGLCPFHKEKTPSFTVNDEKEFYHCFGCGKHGNVINFITEQEGLTYREAAEKLANEFGIPIPQYNEKSEAEEAKKISLYDIMEQAAQFFEKNLKREQLSYLLERGLNRKTIEKFRLGFAPYDSDGLIKAFSLENRKMLADAGLVKSGNTGIYSYFKNRIIFPITNRKGQIIAFGGRGIEDDTIPKYLNSPETDIFNKSSTLYGLDLARKAIYDEEEVIITEGYMDVIAMHQAGFKNTVAPLGTAVTAKHLDLLWNLADEPLFCLDGDEAGKKAMYRVAYMAVDKLKPGKSVKFAFLPKGYDPDDLIKEKGSGAMKEVLIRAVPLVDILWDIESSKIISDTPEQKAAFENRIMKIANSIHDNMVRKYYSEIFRKKLWEGRKNKTASYYTSSRSIPITGMVNKKEALIIYTVINHPDFLHYKDAEEQLAHINFSDSKFAELAEAIISNENFLEVLEKKYIDKAKVYKEEEDIETIYQNWLNLIQRKELEADIKTEISNIEEDYEDEYKQIEEMIRKKLSS